MVIYKLLDFLKKYSNVDFIRDFIEIQNSDSTHNPFKIDIGLVAKWLEAKKGNLKETIFKSYKENIDYILLLPNQKQKKIGRGGSNKEIILLTIDTFKMLCLKSKTQKAEKIRYYYITLEKLVEIYKDDIIKNQQKRIYELEHNLKKNIFPVKGAIYIIQIADGYKLGKTEDMNKRYELYKSAHKDNPLIKYVFYSNDINKLELCIKNLLKGEEYRNRKEFYLIELSDIVNTISACDKLFVTFKCKSCKIKQSIDKLSNHIKKYHNTKEVIKFYGIKK